MKNILALTLSMVSIVCFAQNNQVSHRVTIQIENSASIRPKPEVATQTTYSLNEASMMEEGFTQEFAGIMQVQSNSDWVVHVNANTSYWSYSGEDEDPQMPLSTLQIRKSTATDFYQISENSQNLVNGNAGPFGGDNEFGIDYKVIPGLEYPSGQYEAQVTFTVSHP